MAILIGKSLIYTVKSGETIWSIAHKFDVNPGKMITANKLKGLGAVYSGQSLIIPDYHGKFKREILAFCCGPAGGGSKLPSVLTSLSPCWVEINANGSLSARIDPALLAEAREKRVKVYIHVRSFSDDGEIADQMLERTQARHQLISHLQALLEEYRVAGVNLHLKNISTHNRDYLTLLVQEIASFLRPRGLSTMVTLPAKTGDTNPIEANPANWMGAYDYHNIGKSADYLVVEAYDFHWPDGHAGALAPIFWVKDVLDYALMEVAEEKIILAVPCYGYDWALSQQRMAQLITYQRAIELLIRNQAELLWDEDARSPYFNYFAAGEEHQVWFENCQSLTSKIEMVKKYHLGGLALTNLGYEDPNIWIRLQRYHFD